MFIFMGIDIDALEEAMENDPQVLEAFLMTHADLGAGSSPQDILEKLQSYDESQLNELIEQARKNEL